MTTKEKVLDTIAQMPDDSTLGDIRYRLYVPGVCCKRIGFPNTASD